MGGKNSGVWAALHIRGLSTRLFPNGASTSGLACKQNEDISNIFKSIRKQKLLKNFFIKILKKISCKSRLTLLQNLNTIW